MKTIISQPEPTDSVVKFRIIQTAANCFFPQVPYMDKRSGTWTGGRYWWSRPVQNPDVITERWRSFPDLGKLGDFVPKKSFGTYDEAVEFVLQYFKDRSEYPITFEETRKTIKLYK